MGKWTPKGGQELIDDSSSYDEEISEEEIEPPEDEEEDVDEVLPSPVGSGGKLWMSMYNAKVPEPKAYSGKEDAEKFEGWLKNLLRWYCITR